MIVKCEQCQTRFKIPDDKVTDKGVKVRCNKCGHTFRVTRDMAQPATSQQPAVAPQPAADPFARFGSASEPPGAEVTRPGVFALGVEASRNPDIGAGPSKPPPYPSAPATPFDFGSLTPPGAAAPTVPSVPAFIPSSTQSKGRAPAAVHDASPFDFSAIAPPAPAAAPPPPPPAAFDFSTFAAPPQPPPPPQPQQSRVPPLGSTSPPPPPPAFDFAALGAAPAAAAQQVALPAFDFAPPSNPPPRAAPASSAPIEAMAQQVPAFGGPSDGFFPGDEAPAPGVSSVDSATARSMFDMPAPAPSALPDVPMPEPELAAPRPSQPLARMSAPAPAPVPMAAPPPEESRSRRSVVGVIVNVVIAALLVFGLVVVGSAYLNEGKVSADSLSLDNLKNTFAPSVPFMASDVSNGLYDTRAGRAVFFVRGEVANRSDTATRIVVKAEIVEDGKVVRFAEAYVGEPATPEELYLVGNSDALEALQRKVEKRSQPVNAGGSGSFVVAFTEYPPDLKGFRVRVSARAVPSATATK
ncbi:MAG: hypothetical protein DI536_25445 [Archangium gephyra]|uniref:Zinc finger/thioredoxin putative domain-containing protein n=1 Tax=Archangium gephyra TaxID=48 RepID=A0A2W5VDQ2_9BACT|nr:MAG: hypothetical protein DI536_25445 [Archangium gephyra]